MSATPINRRTFARTVAAAATPLAAFPTAAAADDQPQESARPDPADLVLALVQEHYPHGLEPEQLARIRRHIQRQQARSAALSGFPLTNADEPAPVYFAFRAKDA